MSGGRIAARCIALCVLWLAVACAEGGASAPDAGDDAAPADGSDDGGLTLDASPDGDAAHDDAGADADDDAAPDDAGGTGDADIDAAVCLVAYVDGDDDGFGVGAGVELCGLEALPEGYAAQTGDCDDEDVLAHPGADETVGDGVDQDCDGAEICFTDRDDDGHRPMTGATVASTDLDCDDADEATALEPADDCDDIRAYVHPGLAEVCDGYDNDCSGGLEEDEVDADLDYQLACTSFVDRSALDALLGGADCDPGDSTSYRLVMVYADADLDGFGVGAAFEACTGEAERPGQGFVAGDCDDADALVFPGAREVPGDGIDQSCAGDGDLVLTEANTVFVNAGCVSPCGAGTRASPHVALANAIAAAGTTRAVAVAAGTYTGTHTIRTALYGGFSPTDWSVRDADVYVTTIQSSSGSAPTVTTSAGPVMIDGVVLRDLQFSRTLDVQANTTIVDTVVETSAGGGPEPIVITATVDFRARDVVVSTGSNGTTTARGLVVNGAGARLYVERATITARSSNGHTHAVEMTNASGVGVFVDSTLRSIGNVNAIFHRDGTALSWSSFAFESSGRRSALHLRGCTLVGGDDMTVSHGLDMNRGHLVAFGNDIRGGRGATGSSISGGIEHGRYTRTEAVSNVVVGGDAGESTGVIAPGVGTFVHNTIVADGRTWGYGVRARFPSDVVFVNNIVFVEAAPNSAVGFMVGSDPIVLHGNDLHGPAPITFVRAGSTNVSSLATVNACAFSGCVSAGDNVSVAPSFVGGTPFDHHVTVALPGVALGTWYDGFFADVDIDGDARPGLDGVRAIGADEGP